MVASPRNARTPKLGLRGVVLLTLAVVVAGTAAVSLLWPKTYTAATAVVLDVKSPDPVGGMVLPGLMTAGYMATQVDIINSDRVSQRVRCSSSTRAR